MRKLLVTGGAGFIGSRFVRHMLGEDEACRIVNVDKLTYAGNLQSLGPALRNPRHTFVQADVRDQKLMSRLLADHRPDAIVHFAAESHVDRSIAGPAEFVMTNVVGTFSLLEATRAYRKSMATTSAQAFRFLHVSTDEVYGSIEDDGKFREGDPYAPNSPYAASKAAADHFVRAFHRTYDLPTLITHCSNNYGPYQFPEKLIPHVITNAVLGNPLPVYGDGKHVRDWLHVNDHACALHCVLEKAPPGSVYHIGGDSERPNLDVVKEICGLVDELHPNSRHTPCADLIKHVADRPGHDRRYAIDASRIRRELGWTPKIEFSTGLRDTVAWYLGNQAWTQQTSGRQTAEQQGRVPADATSPDGKELSAAG